MARAQHGTRRSRRAMRHGVARVGGQPRQHDAFSASRCIARVAVTFQEPGDEPRPRSRPEGVVRRRLALALLCRPLCGAVPRHAVADRSGHAAEGPDRALADEQPAAEHTRSGGVASGPARRGTRRSAGCNVRPLSPVRHGWTEHARVDDEGRAALHRVRRRRHRPGPRDRRRRDSDLLDRRRDARDAFWSATSAIV